MDRTVRGTARQILTRRWLLAGVVLLGAALRLYALGATSLWADEINVVVVSRGSLADLLQGARSHVSAPPLDYLVVHLLATRLGENEFLLRFGAAIWSILSIPLAYRLGRRTVGRWPGVAAALLLAASPFHVEFSRQAKFYAALVFFALLSNILFLHASRSGRARDWLAHAATNLVGIYFHPFIALVLLGQWLVLLFEWLAGWIGNRLRRTPPPATLVPFLLSAATTALLFAPWFLWDMAAQAPLGEYHSRLGASLWQSAVSAGLEHPGLAALLAACALLGAVDAPRAAQRQGRLLLALNVLAVGLVVGLDNAGGYWFAPKQALFALPVYLLLAAAGLGCLHAWLRRLAARTPARGWAATALLAAGLLALGLAGSARIADGWYVEKQNWRGAAALLAQETGPGESIAGLDWAALNLRYYEPDLPVQKLENPTPDELARLAAQHARLWYVRDWGLGQRHPALEDWVREQGFATTNLGGVLVSAGEINVETSLELGQRYLDAGQLAEALDVYQEVVEQRPAWGIGHTKLGNVYRQMGQVEAAEVAYRRSIEVDPGYVGAYVNLGGIYDGQGRGTEALALYEAAVEAAPASAWAHAVLGRAYLDRAQGATGLPHMQRAVDLEPENPDWLLALAEGWQALGRPEQAAEVYRRVLAVDPNNQQAGQALRDLEP